MKKLDFCFHDEHKYTLDEIKVGMRVRISQLDDILDTYIILYNLEDVFDRIGCMTMEGEILDISKKRSKKDYSYLNDVVRIINDSSERNYNIEY